MPKIDEEQKILTDYEKGRLKSVATKAALAKFKAAARATKPATGPTKKAALRPAPDILCPRNSADKLGLK